MVRWGHLLTRLCESIGSIKRLNLFRCLGLIAHYTIITHFYLVKHESQTNKSLVHTHSCTEKKR